MPSQLKLLKESRKTGNFNLVDKSIKRRIQSRGSRKSSGSPTNDDIERIIKDYADNSLLDKVINKKTALDVVEELKNQSDNLDNFISGVGKQKMEDKIYDDYAEENLENIRTLFEEIKLKTRTILGYKINTRVYLRETKSGLRAFKFKTNRFAKLPKTFPRRK